MLLAMTAMLASAAGAAPAVDAGAPCRELSDYVAGGSRHGAPSDARPKRLDELPPANLILTVLRHEDGCIVPVIVRYGIGAMPDSDR